MERDRPAPPPGTDAKLALREITHVFDGAGGPVTAVGGISIDIPAGSLVSLIGRSGCGKTTLFNIVAGLLRPTRGRVLLDGEDISGRAGLVSYMLQKDLLLPWRTVLDNVVLGLELGGMRIAEAREHALPLIRRYGLGGFERQYPAALSGGMRQRAALLRTLLCDRDVILLDEPFGALDAQTRFSMQEWLLGLWQDFGRTVVLVTHDVDEAVFLSDEIFVLSPRPGRVRARLPVPLARPRPRGIVTSAEFARTKERCLDLLFEEEPAGAERAGAEPAGIR
jgi:ABC-type nitrate/sulfonate/bicarbonate transport system ATPase subunit